MAQVDASIPLQVKKPEFINPAQMLSLQSMAQQMQLHGQQLQQHTQEAPYRLSHLQSEQQSDQLSLQDLANKVDIHNKVRALAAQPGTFEEDGTPSAQGVNAAMSIDPVTLGKEFSSQRREAVKAKTEDTYKKLQIQAEQGKVDKDFAEAVRVNQTELAKVYESTLNKQIQLRSANPHEDAVNAVQREAKRRLDSGILTEAQYQKITSTSWDKDMAQGIIDAGSYAKKPSEYEDIITRMKGLDPKSTEYKQLDERRKHLTEYPLPVTVMQTSSGQPVSVETQRGGKPPIVTPIKLPTEPWDGKGGGLKKIGDETGNAVPPAQSNLHGEEYLASLQPAEQGLIKSIAEGKIDPKTLSTRGGHRERILQQVVQYQPDYNQQNYGQADAAVKAFGTGKQGQSVRAFNVALEHLDTLQELGNALHNKDTPIINSIANRWKTETGEAGPTSFEGAKQLVADEVVKAIVGSGGGVTDREEAAKTIRAASSPKQLVGIIDTYKHLFGGQIKGLEQQYKAQSKRDDFRERFLTEKGKAAAAKSDATTPSLKIDAPFSDAPQTGAIIKGYKFKGGDPSDKANWEVVKEKK